MSIKSYTVKFQFRIINYNSYDWSTDEEANWNNLDSVLSQMQTSLGSAAVPYVNAAGSTNAYTATYNPAITSLFAGLQVAFKTNAANTGPATLNVNGLGAKALTRGGATLTAAALAANLYVRVIYDGTQWLVVDPPLIITGIDDASITPVKLSAGHPTWDASGNLTVNGTGTALNAPKVQQAGKQVLAHGGAYSSGNLTVSTGSPSGGSDGDIWFKI